MGKKKIKKVDNNILKDTKSLLIVILILIITVLTILFVFGKFEIIKLKKEASKEFSLAEYKEKLKNEMLAEIAESEIKEENLREERRKTKLGEKVMQDKTIGGLKITEIEVEDIGVEDIGEEENRKIINAIVTNIGQTVSESKRIKANFIDEYGNSSFTENIMIETLEPNKSMPIRIDIREDIGQIDDIEFTYE